MYIDHHKPDLKKTFFVSCLFHLLMLLIAGMILGLDQKEGEQHAKRLLVTLRLLPLKGSKQTTGIPDGGAVIDQRSVKDKSVMRPLPSVDPGKESEIPKKVAVEPKKMSQEKVAIVRKLSPLEQETAKIRKDVKVKSEDVKEKASTEAKVVREKVKSIEQGAEKDQLPERSLSEKSASGRKIAKRGSETLRHGAPTLKPLTYLDRVRDQIRKSWEYPPAAKLHGLQGTVTVQFYIYKDGELGEIRIKDSSGFPVLDHGVKRAIEKAAPYEPLPAHLSQDIALVELNFEYSLDFLMLK